MNGNNNLSKIIGNNNLKINNKKNTKKTKKKSNSNNSNNNSSNKEFNDLSNEVGANNNLEGTYNRNRELNNNKLKSHEKTVRKITKGKFLLISNRNESKENALERKRNFENFKVKQNDWIKLLHNASNNKIIDSRLVYQPYHLSYTVSKN